MVLTGKAHFVGSRSGKKKDGNEWCSIMLDALDDRMERVQYFVPAQLVDKVKHLDTDLVTVQVRLYPMKDGLFGSRLLDIDVA